MLDSRPEDAIYTLIGIAVVAAAVIAGAFWMARAARALNADGLAALAALARKIGASAPTAGQPLFLRGTYQGRACSLGERSTYGSRGSSYSTRITVATSTAITLELQAQSSALGAKMVGDVDLGDAEFDKWFIVRTNDVAKVARVLRPDLRAQLIEWLRGGWLLRVSIRDGELTVEGGRGLQRRAFVEHAAALLGAAATIAKGLEARD